jgi:hypothetical protein
MPLAFCTRCGHRVSTTAPRCPSCGTPPYNGRLASASVPTATVTQASDYSTSQGRVTYDRGQSGPAALGIPRPHILVASTLVAISLMGWWAFYLPATPSWAVYSLYRDVRNHDGGAAEQLIDFESVTKGLVNTAITEHETGSAARDEEGAGAFGEIFARGIASLMVAPMSDAFKSRFEQWVDSRDDAKYPMNVGPVLEAILQLRRQGSTAFSQITDTKGETLHITLNRESGGDWKITAVDGKSIREAMRDSMKSGDASPSAGSSPDDLP